MLKIQNLSLGQRLKQVTLALPGDKITCLLGSNGSGKTTLLKCLAGILGPSQGEIFWNEKNLCEMNRRERSQVVSLVPQNPIFHLPFTVAEIVAMGLYARHGTLTITDEILHLLDEMDLYALKDRSITSVSQGEKQRALLARGMAARAPLLLLDEPTADLDPYYKEKVWKLIEELPATVIVATHDTLEAEKYGCVGIKNGSVEFNGRWNLSLSYQLYA